MDAWYALPLWLQLCLLSSTGLWLGGQINRGIYRLAWNPRPIGPWSAPHPDAPARPVWCRLPVVGWLGLLGESPLHGRRYWLRPLLIELAFGAVLPALYVWELNGGLVTAAALQLDVAPETWRAAFLAHATLLSLMTVATFIDFDEQTIPDSITIPGALLGLFFAATTPAAGLPVIVRTPPTWLKELDVLRLTSPAEWDAELDGPRGLAIGIGCFAGWCAALAPRLWTTRRGLRKAVLYLAASVVRSGWLPRLGLMFATGAGAIAGVWWAGGWAWQSLLSSLVGLAFGGGLVWLVRIVAGAALGEEAMGFGDVTLMAMIGAFLGWQPSLLIFFLAPAAALFVSLAQWLLTGRRDIAFGPYLCVATVVVVARWGPLWHGWAEGFFALGWLVPAVLLFCLAAMAILLLIWGVIKRALGWDAVEPTDS